MNPQLSSFHTARRPRVTWKSPGFTLFELLVVVAVIGVLVGLTIPGLAMARERARATRSTSNLTQIFAALSHYVSEERDTYPFGEAGRFYRVAFDEPGMMASTGHWSFDVQWPVLFHRVAPWREHAATWISPSSLRKPTPVPCAYRYSHTFVARPELWSDMPGTSTATLLRPTKLQDVLFPASKVVMWDGEMPYLRRHRSLMPGMLSNPAPMLFVDGHISELLPGKAATPVANVLNPHPSAAQPLHNTPQGVRGRDY